MRKGFISKLLIAVAGNYVIFILRPFFNLSIIILTLSVKYLLLISTILKA